MKTSIKIMSIFGKLLFEYECEENSIKKTVEQAVKEKADLSFADLRSADLSFANLRYADLSFANLRYANLRYANLRYANLRSADLSSANLRYANLRSADLSSANLRSANLRSADLSSANLRYANLRSADLSSANLRSADLSFAKNKEIAFLPMFCKWSVSIIGDKIKIGCKEITIENWDLFFESSEEFDTKRNTEEFKQIQAMYLAYKAYLTHLTS